jgi:muconolactone D-isomerase
MQMRRNMDNAPCFLVSIRITRPAGIDDAEWNDRLEAELARGKELVHDGQLLGIWRLPGQTANVGIWQAESHERLHAALTSLPLFSEMAITVQPISEHPLGGFDVTAR